MRTLYESKHADFSVTDDNLLKVKWKKFTKGEEYREIIKHQPKLGRQEKIYNLLIDCTDLGMIAMDDQEWTVKFATENYDYYGKTLTALIISESLFAKMSVQKVKDDIDNTKDQQDNSKVFGNEEDAVKWLLEQEIN